jgi:ABC-type lipoprotein export system ATPase subunit
MSHPVLEATDIRLTRGESTVLDGVSTTIQPSSRVLIRGTSGSGKTSLFYVLGLLEQPTGGHLTIDGTDITALGERERARIRRDTVGVVFQDFQLVPDLTAWENAALPQEHAGVQDDEWLETLFDRLDIADLADAKPATLSGGEKQRVAIARALANRPTLVLADEPTGQLDPAATDRVLDLLIDVQEFSEAALLVVSHDQQLGEQFNRQLQLVDGRLIEQDADGADPSQIASPNQP